MVMIKDGRWQKCQPRAMDPVNQVPNLVYKPISDKGNCEDHSLVPAGSGCLERLQASNAMLTSS